MPLPELLALYGYKDDNEKSVSPIDDDASPSEQMDESEPDPPDQPSKLQTLYDPIPENDHDASRLLRSVSRVSEEEEEDYDYSPDEDEWRKVRLQYNNGQNNIILMFQTIMVGSDYQAVIPEGLCHYDDALPYENEDKLLWDPTCLEEKVVEDFLKKAAVLMKPAIPMGPQLRDDEQALFLLQQCGHNVDEALRRIRITVMPNSDSMSLWSEEECRNFETGLRRIGKNFHLIQQYKVLMLLLIWL